MHREALSKLNIAIIGGGIGGLTTALSLHQIGMSPVVFESSKSLESVGVGIHLLPNGVRELAELGLLETLQAHSISTQKILYLNRFGQTIWENPRGLAAGYRWPQLAIHRGALQKLLVNAIIERLGHTAIQTGYRCLRAETHNNQALIEFENRHTECQEVRSFDAVIACDGVHSRIREHLYPTENEPIYHGSVMWRGVSVVNGFLDNATMLLAGEPKCKFIAYPIPSYGDMSAPKGKLFLNWIADVVHSPDALSNRRDWFQRGNPDDFLPRYQGWNLGFLDVEEVIQNALDCFVYPKVDKNPLQQWTQGRITLLGDAAHPTYPSGSQGASQAIIDARILARSFQQSQTVEGALQAYNDDRLPTTTRLIEANRAAKQEQLLGLVHERAPNGFRKIEEVLSPKEFDRVFDQFKQVAGHDIRTLNERPAYVAIE